MLSPNVKNRPATLLLAAALTAVFGVPTAKADLLTLADGTVLEGRIVIETAQKIVMEEVGGRRVLDRGQVVSVVRKPYALPPARTAAPASGNGSPAAQPAAGGTDVGTWPPRMGQPYPDLVLRDCNGNPFRLSSLRGRVILVEPVGMSCVACQAFSGGRKCGGFLGVSPQPGLASLEEYLAQFGSGLRFDNPGIAYVQVVIYDINLQPPSVAAVKAWADHFGLSNKRNVYVLVGTREMISPESFNMIPGVHLVDRSFILRSEHFGHGGGSDLYGELLPMAANLVATAN